MEWAKIVIPLVRSGKVKVRGRCISAPVKLEMMQEIMLLVRYSLYSCPLTQIMSMEFFVF